MKNLNVMVVGVGGQGTLLTSRIIGKTALNAGFDVKMKPGTKAVIPVNLNKTIAGRHLKNTTVIRCVAGFSFCQ